MNSGNHERLGRPSLRLLVCAGLATVTALVYWQVSGFDFINFDDETMVLKNPYVLAGMTWKGVQWAFTTSWFEYWHPLTWLSHMLDRELFGSNAGAHHLVSVGFHVANTLLVFLALERMTEAWKRSAMVAALFALHPLHVESVAWVAERKDVLSAFFSLLTLWAYARYAECRRQNVGNEKSKAQSFPSVISGQWSVVSGQTEETTDHYSRITHHASIYYLLSLFFFACGLMSKPMVVTLPFVLLLLDYWPLSRFSLETEDKRLKTVLAEKIPFFALTAASCVITWVGVKAGGFMITTEKVPLGLRLANVPVSYVRYVWKMIWPTDLAVLYPMPKELGVLQVSGAIAILIILTLVAFACVRRRPWVAIGWCWFLGTLVPVIGLLQVGHQAIADRYTYISFLGLFVVAVWATAELWKYLRLPLKLAWVVAGVVLVCCLGSTWQQLRYWKNSIALWTHALAVTTRSADAHHNYAFALEHSGDLSQSIDQYLAALRIEPDFSEAHNNLGRLLCQLGKVQEATNHLMRAACLTPNNPMAKGNLARALALLGDWDGARQQYEAAMALAPADPTIPADWGKVLLAQGQATEAARRFAQALQVDPNSPDARVGYSFALSQVGAALAAQGKPAEALGQYREALRVQADLPEVLNNLAWLLATVKDGQVRDGAEAVRIASRACELTQYQQPQFVGTLAAAYAEAGEFEKARETAQKAVALAEGAGQGELAARNRELLRVYEAGKPYRE